MLTKVKLFDDYDNEVPVGTPGEICVKSPTVFLGYWGLEEETAYTFRNGRHIRVTLIIEKAGRFKRAMEFTVLVVGLFFTGYLTYSSMDMVRDSIRFNDLTQGLINIPLWIPQISIPIGAIVLTIAILDDLLSLIFGKSPSYVLAAENEDPADVHPD